MSTQSQQIDPSTEDIMLLLTYAFLAYEMENDKPFAVDDELVRRLIYDDLGSNVNPRISIGGLDSDMIIRAHIEGENDGD